MTMRHTLNHHSHPVIHYFVNHNPKRSVTRSLVVYYEAHQLLALAVPQEEAGVDKPLWGYY